MEEVEALAWEEHIVFEQYQSSILSFAASRYLRNLTAFFELNPPHIPWYKLRARHVAAPYLYFMSFASAEVGQYVVNENIGGAMVQLMELNHDALEGREAFTKMAKTSDEHLRLLMGAQMVEDLFQLFTSYKLLLK